MVDDDPYLRRVLNALPPPVARSYTWLMRPQAKWVRLPVGLAFIAGGLFSILPILGLWMLPIGALLIGEDIPPVRRATLRMLKAVMDWWDTRRSRAQ
jgi:hypothetical protein